MPDPNIVIIELDRAEMSRRGRLGALVKHSRYDPSEDMAKARAAFNQRFEREVDPDETLPPAERGRRAEYARRAYYHRLAMASAKARKAKKQTAA